MVKNGFRKFWETRYAREISFRHFAKGLCTTIESVIFDPASCVFAGKDTWGDDLVVYRNRLFAMCGEAGRIERGRPIQAKVAVLLFADIRGTSAMLFQFLKVGSAFTKSAAYTARRTPTMLFLDERIVRRGKSGPLFRTML
jgi:hypothetical protein